MAMRAATLASLLAAMVLGALGCSKTSPPPPPPQPASSQPATQAAAPHTRPARARTLAASAPAGPLEDKPSYTLTRDLTLWRIGELRYGNAHYSGLILLYNKLKDAAQIPAGQVVKTPDLKALLTDEKLYPLMADEVDALLAARSSFLAVEADLWTARKASPAGPMTITTEVKTALLAAAENVDKGIAGFGQKKPGVVAVPAKAVGQMKSLVEKLRALSAGKCDESGHDIDMVHERLVFALSDAIRWARNGYK
jgi:hypothetical protein